MTPETRTQLPMASTGCACCTPAPASEQPAAPAAEATVSGGISATYQVEGMTCGHCVASVTEELTALDAVTEVHIDLVAGGTSTVTVITAQPLSTAEVRAAVEEAGYTLVTG